MLLRKVSTKAEMNKLSNNTYYDGAIGFWGIVYEVNSSLNTVSVKSLNGMKYGEIKVLSREWVCKNEDKNYVSSERDLPPVNSIVFVLTPTHSISGAIVIGSGIPLGEPELQELLADENNKTQIQEFNDIKEKIDCGGWKFKNFNKNGNKTIISNDENIKIELIEENDTQKSLNQGINITAFDNEIKINSDGITINSKSGKNINLNGDSKSLVTYAALNTALTEFLTQLTTSMTITPIAGNGTSQETWLDFPTSIDISNAEATRVKTS